MAQIDHDPNEPRRSSSAGLIVSLVTLGIVIPIGLYFQQFVRGLPLQVVWAFDAMLVGLFGGWYLGRWDLRRELGISEPSHWKYYFRLTGYLLLRAPFAIYLLPRASYRRAKQDGDDGFTCFLAMLTGLLLGFMASFAIFIVIAAPIQIMLDH